MDTGFFTVTLKSDITVPDLNNQIYNTSEYLTKNALLNAIFNLKLHYKQILGLNRSCRNNIYRL